MNTISRSQLDVILRNDLMSFIERSFCELNPQTTLIEAAYMRLIAAKLESCVRGETRRLIINIPPRSLKTISASIALPAWYLGHYPEREVICVSYGQDLSTKFARDTRTVMKSDWYSRIFPTKLSDRQAVNGFETTDRGGRLATSVGGVLTGRGADLIIIDDPLKPQDALSESLRTDTNEWYDNTLLSRLNNKSTGCIIIVMQRLHENDLVGHVLQQEPWEVLSLPAIAIEDELYQYRDIWGDQKYERKAGSTLNPKRESAEDIEKIRAAMREYDFLSQYQQMPIPLGGSIIKTEWLKYYQQPPSLEQMEYVLQSWDTGQKTTENNSYSVCTTWGLYRGDYYLLHVYRKRSNYPDLKRAVIEQFERFKPNKVIIEDKAAGTALLQDLNEKTYHLEAYTPPPSMDKLMRLHAQSDLFEAGKVFLPESATWLEDYRTEVIGFPGSKYNDQVDSTAQALDCLKKGPSRSFVTWQKLGRQHGPLLF